MTACVDSMRHACNQGLRVAHTLRRVGFADHLIHTYRKGHDMKVMVEVELDVNEVNVAYEYGLEIGDVADFVKDAVASDMYTHYDNLGWLNTGRGR